LQPEIIFYYCTIRNQQNNDCVMSKKQLFTLEYPVRCSPSILYDFLSTPAGLQEWFADKVDERDSIFSFSWNGAIEKAEILEGEEEKFVRFHWVTAPKEEYFEFRIEKSEVTNQTILVIHDFADKKEIKDQSQLWDYQVKDLLHRIGS
jgi:START-like superfamily domain